MDSIILILRDINHWGQKYLVESLAKKDKLYIIFHNAPTQQDIDFLHKHNIDYKKDDTPKYLVRLEVFLSFFVRPLQSNNFKSIRKRNLLRHNNIKSVLFYHLYSLTPKFLSVDSVAKFLGLFRSNIDLQLKALKPKTVIYISRFLVHHHHICRAHKLNYKVTCWLYSWDHQYKDSFLPSIFSKYIVWNDEMKNELNRIHYVPIEKQVVSGPVQFDYLKLYRNLSLDKVNDTELSEFISCNKKEYLLYLFGTGYEPALSQEIELVQHIAKMVEDIDPNIPILARPYPDSKYGSKPFYKLNELPNVYVQKDLKQFNVQDEQTNIVKVLSMKNALGVINLYTTMGLEASYTDTPIIQLAYIPKVIKKVNSKKDAVLSIHSLMNNEHLNKFLFKKEYANVVNDDKELYNLLKTLIIQNHDFNDSFNRYLQIFCHNYAERLAMSNFCDEVELTKTE